MIGPWHGRRRNATRGDARRPHTRELVAPSSRSGRREDNNNWTCANFARRHDAITLFHTAGGHAFLFAAVAKPTATASTATSAVNHSTSLNTRTGPYFCNVDDTAIAAGNERVLEA